MQPPKIREVVRRLQQDGFILDRDKGGRRIYHKGDLTVTIHGKDSDTLKPGTWSAIKRQAGWR